MTVFQTLMAVYLHQSGNLDVPGFLRTFQSEPENPA